MNTRLLVFSQAVGTTSAKEQDEVCKGQGKHQAAQQFVLGPKVDD